MAAVAAVVAAVAAFSPPVAAAGHAGEPPTAEAGSHACGERVVALSEGFNLVGLVAPASPGGFAARAVYGWEAGSQSFASWRAGVPASLNGLEMLAAIAVVRELAGGGAGVAERPGDAGGGAVAADGRGGGMDDSGHGTGTRRGRCGGAWLEAGPGAGVLVLRGGPQASRTASLVAGWNAASASAGFAGDPTGWRDANALCWYAMFGPEAEAAIRAVVATASMESGASDICTD